MGIPMQMHRVMQYEECLRWEVLEDGTYYCGDEKAQSEIEAAWDDFTAGVRDAAITYGYNPEVVANWINETGSSWEELDQRQQQEVAEKAQADIKVAADYMHGILDNARVDIQKKMDDNQA